VDSANHRIKKHQPDGTFISIFGSSGTGNNNFKYPICIAYNSGNLYITDKQNHRVKTHQVNGTFLSEFGSYGTGDNNLNFPEGIAIVNNDIVVADSGNNEVKTFNISGVFITKVTDTVFGYPVGITSIEDQIFAVIDKTRNTVFFYDDTSSLITQFGSVGTGDDEFSFPISAAYDSNAMFVTDSANHRVKILDVVTTVEVPVYKDQIVKLTKQLYPTGRAWWMPFQGTFYKLNEALALSESRALEYNTGLLDSILPDNDNFTEEDAFNWESALGLYIQTGLSLADRKAAILRRMHHPGDIKARQHYLYLEGQLQAAGFSVYVHENRFDTGGGVYEILNIVPAIYGEFSYGNNVYGNVGVSNYTKIANYVSETKDATFDFGGSVNLRATFFIGGQTFGTRANVDADRKDEFRHLILTIKPAQTAGFLLTDYV